MVEKRKIKICDFDGTKLDSAVVSNKKEARKRLKMWELKGWL